MAWIGETYTRIVYQYMLNYLLYVSFIFVNKGLEI